MAIAMYVLFFMELALALIYAMLGIRNLEGRIRVLTSCGALIINIALIVILAYCKMQILWFSIPGVIFLCLVLRDTYELGYYIGNDDGFKEGVEEARAKFEATTLDEIIDKVCEMMQHSDEDDEP